MQEVGYKVFLSHGKQDSWLAAQIAKEIRETGTNVFLDETDIQKGEDFKKRIHQEIKLSKEMVVLFTPWSAKRYWVWVEIGAAWIQEIRVVAVFYRMNKSDLEENGQGKAILEDINMLEINELELYINELHQRVGGMAK